MKNTLKKIYIALAIEKAFEPYKRISPFNKKTREILLKKKIYNPYKEIVDDTYVLYWGYLGKSYDNVA